MRVELLLGEHVVELLPSSKFTLIVMNRWWVRKGPTVTYLCFTCLDPIRRPIEKDKFSSSNCGSTSVFRSATLCRWGWTSWSDSVKKKRLLVQLSMHWLYVFISPLNSGLGVSAPQLSLAYFSVALSESSVVIYSNCVFWFCSKILIHVKLSGINTKYLSLFENDCEWCSELRHTKYSLAIVTPVISHIHEW